MVRIIALALAILLAIPAFSDESKEIQGKHNPHVVIKHELEHQTALLEEILAKLSFNSGNSNQPGLRALWYDKTCESLIFVETLQRIQVRTSPPFFVVFPTSNTPVIPAVQEFQTAEDGIEWLIKLFIRVNGLDATVEDVPIDGSGQRECYAWNTEVISN